MRGGAEVQTWSARLKLHRRQEPGQRSAISRRSITETPQCGRNGEDDIGPELSYISSNILW